MSKFILTIEKNINSTSNFSFHLNYSTSEKFNKDKIYYEDEQFLLIVDGVIFNKTLICGTNSNTELKFILINMYKSIGDNFFKSLKGSYYGALFDKKKNKWIVFTDHIGSKPMYFAETDNYIVFSNHFISLLHDLKNKGRKVSLNEQGAYLLLSYGFVFEDITITNEIKRQLIGYYSVVIGKDIIHKKFYQLINNPIEISEEQAIEQLDFKFRNAIKLQFDKDKEYGYSHLASLSGGLDSRMTVWVAHDLGYTEQLNITFSQSNYLDETIAKKIASDLKHEWIFKALDNGNFLKSIEETTNISGGNVLYYGLAHGLSLYKNLNFENYGVLHSGQLGDVVVGTFYSSLNEKKQYAIGDGAYTKENLSFIQDIKLKEEYANEEIFKFYIRGFYGANQGLLGIMNYTETMSPFYDIDFLEFALSIPLKYRYDHYIYKKWIKNKYIKASSYIWEKEKVPVNYKFWLNINGNKAPINQLHNKIATKLGIEKYGFNTKNNMNPLEYWYNSNSDLKEFMDGYYNKNIHLLNNFTPLKYECEKIYWRGKLSERQQVLSLLGIIKVIFS